MTLLNQCLHMVAIAAFWTVFGFFVAAPLVALIRNIARRRAEAEALGKLMALERFMDDKTLAQIALVYLKNRQYRCLNEARRLEEQRLAARPISINR